MIHIVDNASLLPFNTFGIDVSCRRLVEYDSVESLRSILPLEGPVLNVGVGSNLLFTADYCGTVLHSRIADLSVSEPDAEGNVTVVAGAGILWDDLVAWSVLRGLSGLENMSLIPGETGSAAVQNIGAYGAEIKDVVLWVDTIDLATGGQRRFDAGECRYAYRDSVFKRPDMKRYVITHVAMRLATVFEPNLSYRALAERLGGKPLSPMTVRREVMRLRQGKLPEPSMLGNAGSFFKNPVVTPEAARALREAYPGMPEYPVADGVKLSAGWLIDRAGWKGRALGRAGVYAKQALVLVNLGGASGADIVTLANAVTADVEARFGVTLSPEVNIL